MTTSIAQITISVNGVHKMFEIDSITDALTIQYVRGKDIKVYRTITQQCEVIIDPISKVANSKPIQPLSSVKTITDRVGQRGRTFDGKTITIQRRMTPHTKDSMALKRLADTDIIEIYHKYLSKTSVQLLSDQYKMKVSTVYNMCSRISRACQGKANSRLSKKLKRVVALMQQQKLV